MESIDEQARQAGLGADDLLEAAEHLCRLRGTSPDNPLDMNAAIAEIIKFRQVEQAIASALL